MGRLGSQDVGTGAVAGVGETHCLQLVQILPIDVKTLALHISFFPRETQPAQIVLTLLGKLTARTLRIEILNAQ